VNEVGDEGQDGHEVCELIDGEFLHMAVIGFNCWDGKYDILLLCLVSDLMCASGESL
jgi:hypothetical protein